MPEKKYLPYLSSKCGSEFAFWIENEKTVYFAKPLFVGVNWPAEVVLMQHLKQLRKDVYRKSMSRTAASVMGTGMANHFDVDLKEVSLEGVRQNPILFGVTFVEARGDEIRQDRLAWVVGGATSSPEVNLSTHGKYLHRLYLMAALRLIEGSIPDHQQTRVDGHNIGALLVSRQGEVLAMGLNNSTENKTYHAELNLLQAYAKSGGGMPAGSFLYSSLKPCDMCAAMIKQLLPCCTVIYSQDDPKATGTVVPTGGMTALRNVAGAKQLKFVGPNQNKFAYDAELDQTLARLKSTNQKNHLYYLTNIVDQKDVRFLMSATQRGLVSKSTKYSNSLDYYGTEIMAEHPEVVKVLEHLAEVVEFEGPMTSPDYERLTQESEMEIV
jgi:tRNA(Arg) A34 adenosine deaminase TadA